MSLVVREIERDGRRIVLAGTTIITTQTVQDVSDLVGGSDVDTVVVDYDETRWKWLKRLRDESEVNLVDVLRSGEMVELNSRLAMGIVAKWTAPRCDVREDDEYRAAIEAAGDDAVFGRRPVEVEGLRAWRKATPWQRLGLGWRLVTGSLRSGHVADDDVEGAANAFDPEAAREEVIRRAGVAAAVLIDESEALLADAVAQANGTTVLLTRAAHLDAVEHHLAAATSVDGTRDVPKKSLFSRVVPWLFSAAIVLAFILGFVFADTEKMTDAVLAWSVSNMVMSAIGAAVATAHPIAIIATSLSSPFVSLNPALGAGLVGAIVQAFVAPPTVADMDRVGDDITRLSGWWRNRLSRILLVFVFGNLFSTAGSFAAIAWFSSGA